MMMMNFLEHSDDDDDMSKKMFCSCCNKHSLFQKTAIENLNYKCNDLIRIMMSERLYSIFPQSINMPP